MSRRILLVEDDEDTAEYILKGLREAGLTAEHAADGRDGLYLATGSEFDAIVLDRMLPGLDGISVLKALRAAGLETPVLILTARSTVGDRVLGLNTGADDYLAKPFDLDELEARVRALARRRPQGGATTDFCGLRADPGSGAIYLRERPLELSTREAALLRALLVRPGHAVPKERLFELVFPGQSEVQTEAIEVVAYRLRKKLAGSGTQLMTLRGLGYLLRADDAEAS